MGLSFSNEEKSRTDDIKPLIIPRRNSSKNYIEVEICAPEKSNECVADKSEDISNLTQPSDNLKSQEANIHSPQETCSLKN